jgi:AcrR family transcriptional regulator
MVLLSGARAQQKARTRREVLTAARALFAERGFEGATARAVAERAGVSAGTVFVHFRDKQALLEACLEQHLEEVLDDAFATAPQGPVVSELVYVASRLFESYAADPALARVLVKESVFSPPDDDGTRVHGAQLARFGAWLEERLARAAARGELARGADPSQVLFGFFALYLAVLAAGLRGDVPFEAQASLLEAQLRQLSCFSPGVRS